MNQDPNDLLYTNTYIPKFNSVGYNDALRDEFKSYYLQELQNSHDENEQDIQDLNVTDVVPVDSKRFKKPIKTYVSIDSRDRNNILYPLPNSFKIFLGRTFLNVSSIKLSSVEFPNTAAVVSSTNNKIYWRNQEDINNNIIDTVTQTYPVYSVTLRTGSYIATTLQSEIISAMKLIKRENKTGDFHYFNVVLDIDTDVVTFTSLILSQLPTDSVTTISGTGIITINAPSHGYASGDVIYLVGSLSLAGISSTELNTFHTIIVINSNTFQFETTTKASSSGTGGGSNINSGKKAPFQLLFGEYNNIIASKIGYYNENSSQQNKVYIKKMQNLFLAHITTSTPHALSTIDIGSTCTLLGSNTDPNIDGVKVIIDVISPTSFLVSINSILDVPSFNFGQVTIDVRVLDIASVENYISNTILLTTFTNHNYSSESAGKSISLYDTISQPSFDGTNTIFNVLSPTEIVLLGSLLPTGNVDVSTFGDGGFIPVHNSITTVFRQITNITPGAITIITAPGHLLKVGDKVFFNNVFTTPSITEHNSSTYTVSSVMDSDTFTINYFTTNVSPIDNDASIGTSLLYFTFPNHGFNNIVSITNGSSGTVIVQTMLPHLLLNGDSVRIMNSNCVPSIDDGGYTVTIISLDTFSISFPISLSTIGTNGIIGMNHDFYLYSVESVGGFSVDILNNNKFTIRDIIDENTFTFTIDNYFSTSQESGGGENVFMNSLYHGFNGVQTNTKNGVINKSISLEGENYSFIVCPQLGSMLNTGDIKNIFARIILDQSPGNMVFNYLSNPKTFDTIPLDVLEYLEFSIVNYDGTLYDFNSLDFSFTLEILEIIDTSQHFNISSKRGIPDSAQ